MSPTSSSVPPGGVDGVVDVEEVADPELRAAVTAIEAAHPRLLGRRPACCNWLEEDWLTPAERRAALARDDLLFLLGEPTSRDQPPEAPTPPDSTFPPTEDR